VKITVFGTFFIGKYLPRRMYFEHFPLRHAAKTPIREIWDNKQPPQSIRVYCNRLLYILAAFFIFILQRCQRLKNIDLEDLERWLNIV